MLTYGILLVEHAERLYMSRAKQRTHRRTEGSEEIAATTCSSCNLRSSIPFPEAADAFQRYR